MTIAHRFIGGGKGREFIESVKRTADYRTASSSERDKDSTNNLQNLFEGCALNPLTMVRGSVNLSSAIADENQLLLQLSLTD